ncbi:MAG: helix-turn-helix domain-containing protein [Ginsengibacter sp.]
MLSYTQYKPSGTLANYIECYWICRGPLITTAPVERLIPGGRTEMILNFGHPMQFMAPDELSDGKAISGAHIMGQRNRIYYARQNGDTDLLGVRFKPGGVSAFTKLPLSNLLNQIIPAEYVLGDSLKDWENRLTEKKNDADKIYLLDTLIMQITKGTTTEWTSVCKAVETIRKDKPVSVNALCNENESYYKKLERAFMKYVGYTPKSYCRIVRFNRAIRQMQINKKSLTSVCYDCDYYDQSHFIKDFRQFTGTAPKHFQVENHSIAMFLISQQAV